MSSPARPTVQPTIRVGGGTIVMFILAPLFIAFGWFLWEIQHLREADWAIFQAAMGTVLFWLGVIMFFTACLIIAIRQIVLQHLKQVVAATHWRS